MSIQLKQRHAVASMTNAIEDVHAQVDRALAKSAILLAKAVEAREEIGSSGTVAQKELEDMYAGTGAILQVRSHYIRSHALLANLAGTLGLVVTADGGLTKPNAALAAVEQSTGVAA